MLLDGVLAFAFGVAVAVVTTPVGVSGAVFMLPVQTSVLGVPSPAATPTNLLYNVIAIPGALWRYSRRDSLRSPLVVPLVLGTLPGVIVGAIVRVFVVSEETTFRALMAVLFLPLGLWLLFFSPPGGQELAQGRRISAPTLMSMGFGAGVAGGIYGIGGGSLLGPILVASGVAIRFVAPAALLTTFTTSVAGAVTFALLAVAGNDAASPDWGIGIAAGIGGLLGGYVGASLQPRIPDQWLRWLLGGCATALAIGYIVQGALD